jgi:uncharacterized membrane-anchored protein YjiN (DUF445 family)
MKDHEIRELVDKLTSVAKRFHDTQQLREQIAHCIRPLQDDPMNGMWHKIAALLMLRQGEGAVHITLEDIQALDRGDSVSVAEMPNGLLIRLISKDVEDI